MPNQLHTLLATLGVTILSATQAPTVPQPQAVAASPAPTAAVEAEIIATIRGRLDAAARNDTKAWASYIADDCLTIPLEKVGWKQAEVEKANGQPISLKVSYGPFLDIQVRVHGNTALVAFRAREYMVVGEQTSSHELWQLDTLVRRGEAWVQVASVALPISQPPADPTAAKVDSKVLDAYVGQYEWAPGVTTTLTREGDRLFATTTGQGRHEWLPETESTLFQRGETFRISLMRDAKGAVTHFVFRAPGASDLIAKKVK